MDKNSFSPKYTEKQKLNNLLHDGTKRTKGDIFMMAGGETGQEMWLWKPANISSHFFRGWGKPQHQLPSCVPSWTTELKPRVFPSVPGSLPPSSANQICRPETRKEVSSAGPPCSASEENPSIQSPLSAKTAKQEMLFFYIKNRIWATESPICGLRWFRNPNCTWETVFPPADGSGHGMSLHGSRNGIPAPKDPSTPRCQPFYSFSWNSFLFKSMYQPK